ncbi:hypothetical protein MATL_G00260330 [Megalops atlanticus]|uniref:Lymphoid-restricted membrane protein n=1 Tax=Megalops atlanticus TaxID=7932 RepID=A0A9D3P8W3_MEGAT|nr:hypothetical protein MATL_G00260330 [Megalops atlanticus]
MDQESSAAVTQERRTGGAQDTTMSHAQDPLKAQLPAPADSPQPVSAPGEGQSRPEEPGVTDGDLSQAARNQSPQGPKRDAQTLRRQFKTEMGLSRSMEAIKEHKAQEELSDMTQRKGTSPVSSEGAKVDFSREDRNSSSPNGTETESEFHLLSLGFKCDMFTLEKRLQLEERSRDLAEDNVKKEVSSCQELLQKLAPLCRSSHHCMEIIHKLQKNLDILPQSVTRMSIRAEMLGAINHEKKVCQSVEVMIQHVENLKKMYTTEHAELLELRETLVQCERSFSPNTDRDDFRNKKALGTQSYPLRSQGAVEVDADRMGRRSSWKGAGRNSLRPSLKRFISTCAWVENDEPSLLKGVCRNEETDSPPEDKKQEEVVRRKSSLTELGNKLTSLIMPAKTPDHPGPQLEGASPPLPSWLSVALVVLLAALLTLLGSLALMPGADAAPVGTGDSWESIPRRLWSRNDLGSQNCQRPA